MKRFTECSKWGDQWYRKLPPRLKCLWQFICDNCDGAGVIDLDWDLASFQIGEDVTEPELAALGGRVIKLPNGKLWIESFITFQYGTLSQACLPHRPVFALIKKHGLERLLEGYQNPTSRAQETEKDKEEEKDKDKPARAEQIEFPENLSGEPFKAKWAEYISFRKAMKHKPLLAQSQTAQLKILSGYGLEIATEAINSTIANGYQGIFPEKIQKNQSRNGSRTTGPRTAAARDADRTGISDEQIPTRML